MTQDPISSEEQVPCIGSKSIGNGVCTVTPLAIRGRADGAELEAGQPNAPYNALRAGDGDGGSSRQSLIAISDTPIDAYQCHGSNVGPMGTLRQGNGALTTGGTPFLAQETVVRRLTERECERLQGYPDDWTAGQSGSARYRQLGNSVAVPVVEWIARRMVAVDSRTQTLCDCGHPDTDHHHNVGHCQADVYRAELGRAFGCFCPAWGPTIGSDT